MAKITFTFLLIIQFHFLNAQIIYVNQNNLNGSNDGTSWDNAFDDLQAALLSSEYGDSIWVVAGTYYTTSSTNRFISFPLLDGRKIFGGFIGSETALNQRDWTNNSTILSGDIGILGDSTDNAYNIIRCEFADSTTVLDGFTVTGGNANDEDAISTSFQRNGGGLFFENDETDTEATPQIKNCTFSHNSSNRRGGGVYVRSAGNKKSILKVENTNFEFNFSNSGGGIFIENSGDMNNHFITDCKFTKNQANIEGSGINYRHSSGSKNIIINNSDFIENYYAPSGACINVEKQSTNSQILIDSCFFERNKSSNSSTGTILNIFNFSETNTPVLIMSNCQSFNNERSSGIISILDFYHEEYYFDNCNFIEKNPLFSDKNIIFIDGIRAIFENCIVIKPNNTVIPSTNFGGGNGTDLTLKNCLIKVASVGACSLSAYNTIFDIDIFTNSSQPALNSCSNQTVLKNNIFNVSLDENLINSQDIGINENNQFNTHPLFVNAAEDNYNLLPCSPGQDEGDSTLVDFLTDLNGNDRVQGLQIDIGPYETLPLTVQVDSVVSPSCTNETGSVELSFDSGCAPFTIVYSDEILLIDSTRIVFDSLPSGINTFIVSDENMDADTLEVFINQPELITASFSPSSVLCEEQLLGNIQTNVTGGTGELNYVWNTGDTTANLENLSAGVYSVTISGENNCSLIDSITLNSEGLIPLSITVTPISCFDSEDGTATVEPISGIAPFTWLWADGQDSSTIENLNGGNYSVTVTDAIGCTDALEFSISPPDSLSTDIEITPVACNGEATGTALATVEGGTEPYSYLWNNSTVDSLISNLEAGLYSVTINDVKGCTDTAFIQINEPSKLLASIEGDEFLCFNEFSELSVLASGGTYPYGFQWESGEIDSILQNVIGGSYMVTITDANGCDTILDYTVVQSDEITIDTNIVDNTNINEPNGSISITNILGGTPDYSYLWEDGTENSSLSNLPAGLYGLTITDADSCQQTLTFEVDFISDTKNLNLESENLLVFPNPANEQVTFQLNNSLNDEFNIQIIDLLGRIVWNAELEKGDKKVVWCTSKIPNGGYIYYILQDRIILESNKIIVQH